MDYAAAEDFAAWHEWIDSKEPVTQNSAGRGAKL
jgi:hypothetical protein